MTLFFSGTQLAAIECVKCRKKQSAKSSSGYKKLQKVVTFDGAYRLKETVVKRNDAEWMVVQLGSLSETEIIAKEFYYHKTCWKSYCDKREIDKIQKAPNADEVKRNEYFKKLCQTINEKS